LHPSWNHAWRDWSSFNERECPWWIGSTLDLGAPAHQPPRFGDFNGDGLPDLYYRFRDEVRIPQGDGERGVGGR
jgi:hypothetical protein